MLTEFHKPYESIIAQRTSYTQPQVSIPSKTSHVTQQSDSSKSLTELISEKQTFSSSSLKLTRTLGPKIDKKQHEVAIRMKFFLYWVTIFVVAVMISFVVLIRIFNICGLPSEIDWIILLIIFILTSFWFYKRILTLFIFNEDTHRQKIDYTQFQQNR